MVKGTISTTEDLINIPQNVEAEASLLGSILIDADAIVKIADLIKIDDFTERKHQLIYQAIINLYEDKQAIDVLTLSDKLSSLSFLKDIGGSSYLTELTNFVPTASHIEEYAEIVAQKALRRRLIRTAQEISDLS